MLWALEVEYDGTAFMGWQRQKHGLAIQQIFEEAGARLCGGVMPAAVASGRTDAGVHATGQVVQMALPAFTPHRIREALNFHFKPHRIAVLRAAAAPAEWNARFSAISRVYRYVILNRDAFPTLDIDRVWHVTHPLDAVAMHDAAQLLIGHHDFSTFRATACQARSPLRTLDELTVQRAADRVIIRAAARSFLHHQVRNMAGALKLVGEGRWAITRVADALAEKSRAAGGPTAPAGGLYLTGVSYEHDPFKTRDNES